MDYIVLLHNVCLDARPTSKSDFKHLTKLNFTNIVKGDLFIYQTKTYNVCSVVRNIDNGYDFIIVQENRDADINIASQVVNNIKQSIQ